MVGLTAATQNEERTRIVKKVGAYSGKVGTAAHQYTKKIERQCQASNLESQTLIPLIPVDQAMATRVVSFYQREENWHHEELRETWIADDSEQQTIPSKTSANGEQFYLGPSIAHVPAKEGRHVQYYCGGVIGSLLRPPPTAAPAAALLLEYENLHDDDDYGDDSRRYGKEKEKSPRMIVSSPLPVVIRRSRSMRRINNSESEQNNNGTTRTMMKRNKNHHLHHLAQEKIKHSKKMTFITKKAKKVKRTTTQDNSLFIGTNRRCRHGESCRFHSLKGVCIFDHDQDEHLNNIKTRKRKGF